MKTRKLTLLATLLLAMASTFAQEGGIIYTQYEPDRCVESERYHTFTINMDIDGDGVKDCGVQMDFWRLIYFDFLLYDGWERCNRNFDDESDTIVSGPHRWFRDGWTITADATVGLRKVVNDTTVYYGWLRLTYQDLTNWELIPPYEKEIVCVHDMAFCTIPNYPLRWGQTSLTGIEENGSAAFATVHPNPTTGLVTIVGENLNQADVVNMLGQCVATVQGKGKTLQIDISSLPAGIYFVRITDDEGRKCTHKVVKE